MAKVVIAISKSKKERDNNSFKNDVVNDNIKRILSAEIKRLENENKKKDNKITYLTSNVAEYEKLYCNAQLKIDILYKENEALKSEIEKLKSATKTTIEPTKERKENKKEVSEKDITILEKLFPTYKFSNELRVDIIRHHCPSEYEYYNSDCPNDAECNYFGSCNDCWNRPCSDFIQNHKYSEP